MFHLWGSRQFHKSCHLTNKNNQLAKAMQKLLGGAKNTHPQKDVTTMLKPEMFSKGATEGKRSSNSRRSKVLNKVFMTYITDIMATGVYSSEIVGRGIEINRVKIAPNFKILNVFWTSKDCKNEDKVEEILRKNAGYLKSELSALRVMGIVPDIHFVKDKYYATVTEVERRLAKADFGEDHVPVDPATKLRTELELFIPLDEQIKERLQEIEEDTIITEAPLPAMAQNIFGVNHSDILERVKKSMKKSQSLHRQTDTGSENSEWHDFKSSQTVNNDPISLGNERAQQEAFKKFLKSREIMKLKATKKKRENLDLEYLQNEYYEKSNDHLNELERCVPDDDEDYILDDIEEER